MEIDMLKWLDARTSSVTAAEVSAKRLLLWTRILSSQNKPTSFKKTPQEVQEEFHILEQRLKEELFSHMTYRAQSSIKRCNTLIETLQHESTPENFGLLAQELQKIGSELRKIDILQLLYLHSLNDLAAKQIKDKNIVICLGGSGAGISTISHYLAGSKLEACRANGQLITVMELDPTHIGMSADTTKIVLCDPPGFSPEGGTEDISNIVDIIRVAKLAQSVKIVFLIPGDSTATKCAVLKDHVQNLVDMIPDLSEHLDSILFCYTRFNERQQEEFNVTLTDVYNTLTRDDPVYIAFKKMKNTKFIFIDPFSGVEGAQSLYQKILDLPPILNPENSFRFSISRRTSPLLEIERQRGYAGLMKALERSDANFVAYKMVEVKDVSDLLDIPNYYKKCCELVDSGIRNKCKRPLEVVTECLLDGNDLTLNDIQHFCNAMEQVRLFEPIGSAILEDAYPIAIGMANEFLSRVSRGLFPSEPETWTSDPKICCSRLDKAKILSESFIADISTAQQIYKHAVLHLRQYLEDKLGAFKAIVDKFDFKAAAEQLGMFSDFRYHQHLENFDVYKLGIGYIKNRFGIWEADPIREVQSLSKICTTEYVRLECVPELVVQFSRNLADARRFLQFHLDAEELQRSFVADLRAFLVQLQSNIKSVWNGDEVYPPQLENYLILMDSLLPLIKGVDDSLMEIRSSVGHYLSECLSKLNITLSKNIHKEILTSEDVDELVRSTIALRDSWLDKFLEPFPGRKDLYKRVKDLLKQLVRNRFRAIEKTEIYLWKFKSTPTIDEPSLPGVLAMQTACSLFEQLSSMIELQNLFPKLKKEREKVEHEFVCMMAREIDKIMALGTTSELGEAEPSCGLTFDPFLVNASFIFLKHLQNIFPKSIKDASVDSEASLIDLCSRAQSELQVHVQLYLKQLRDSIDRKFEEACTKAEGFSYRDRECRVKDIISNLNMLQHLHDTWPRIIDCAANTSELYKVVPEWKQKLKDLPKEFSLELEMALTSDKRLLANLLDSAKAFFSFDQFLGSNDFLNLWLRFSRKRNNLNHDIYQKALEYVKDSDWDSFINIQTSVDPEHYVHKIRSSLSRSVVTFIEKLRRTAHLLSAHLDVEMVKDIVAALGKLVTANNNISDKFWDQDAKEKLDRIQNDISEIVQCKIRKFLESVEKQIQSDDYIEAEEMLEHLTTITNCVGSLNICSEKFNVAEMVATMSEDLKKRYDEIPSKYQKLGMNSFFCSKTPKWIHDQLATVSPSHKGRLTDVLLEISTTAIQSLSAPTQGGIDKLKRAIGLLPDTLYSRLVEDLEQKIEQLKQQQMGEVAWTCDMLLEAISKGAPIINSNLVSLKTDLQRVSSILDRSWAPSAAYSHHLCLVVERLVLDANESLDGYTVDAIVTAFPKFGTAICWIPFNDGIRFEFRTEEEKKAALYAVPQNSGSRIHDLRDPSVQLLFKDCPPVELGVSVEFANVPGSFIDLPYNELVTRIKDVTLDPKERNSVLSASWGNKGSDRVKSTHLTVCFSSAPIKLVLQDFHDWSNSRNHPLFMNSAFPALQLYWQWGDPHKTCPHCHLNGHVFATCPFADNPLENSDVLPVVTPPPHLFGTSTLISTQTSNFSFAAGTSEDKSSKDKT
jgi:hypothetical protein